MFHLIERYSIEESSDFLGLSYSNTRDLLEASISSLLEAYDNIYTREQLLEKIESLPDRIAPPPSVWAEIEKAIRQQKVQSHEEEEKSKIVKQSELDKAATELKADEKKLLKKEPLRASRPTGNFLNKTNKKVISAILIAILTALCYYFFFYDKVNWELTGSTSTVFINGEAAFSGSIIDDDETISAPGSTSFSVKNNVIGRIQASGNASFKTIDDSSLNFIRGSFRIHKENADQSFHAVVPSAIIKDELPGGYYELEISRIANTTLRNGSGTLIVTSGKTEFFLPPGYECYITRSLGAGIPYHSASAEQIKNILNEPGLSKDQIADRILVLAQNRDIPTLWNMLMLVSPMKRGELFDFMAKNIHVPSSITKDGIVYLNKNMLSELRKLVLSII